MWVFFMLRNIFSRKTEYRKIRFKFLPILIVSVILRNTESSGYRNRLFHQYHKIMQTLLPEWQLHLEMYTNIEAKKIILYISLKKSGGQRFQTRLCWKTKNLIRQNLEFSSTGKKRLTTYWQLFLGSKRFSRWTIMKRFTNADFVSRKYVKRTMLS